MKQFLVIALVFFVAAGTLSAQQEKQQKETRVVVKQERERTGFYTIRFGAWWPKDAEKTFKWGDVETPNAQVDQSQALGLDFHFRKMMTHPLYFDVSAGAWYTTYKFNFTDQLESFNTNIEAWAVIVPVTLGLSVSPLPAESPIQPYAMAGLGAYVGITGYDKLLVSNENQSKDTKSYVRFGYYLGAGFDFLFADTFGVSIGAKYQFLEFQDYLATQQKDFTGLQATIGIAMVL